MEDILKARRKKILLSLSSELVKALREIIKKEGLELEDGKPYPLSYLVEDMILWILSDPQRYQQFIDDNFEEVEEDAEEGEK